ncbi:LysR family transcriptional regulator [Enterovibrio norvegicus]|nr:LysR family transcriptional regulator [Enterovibrio norvegicus]PMN44330.1 LysR family transcriptional regulator [Enterovibrio norvegicus]TKF16592.1 LysR family transcriptional regulator [Enterovibrio norvegicus]TKF29630.1 LysR family transcriptional regulator [Enterovibrio norvegicus]
MVYSYIDNFNLWWNMLNPKWLNTFETLAETSSFTQTAERLFMTQPGVSQHIKKLEAELGEVLIYREGKQFELTQAGMMLMAFVAEQKQQQNDFLVRLKADSPHQGSIRIACSGTMAMTLYPLLLAHQKQHPDLSIHLEAAPAERIRHYLMENLIDIGISTQRIDHPSILENPLGEEDLSIVVPVTANIESNDYAGLIALGYINHPDGQHYADLVFIANFAAQYRGLESMKISGYVNQLAQILLPVSKGLGFTVLPTGVIDGFSAPKALACFALEKPISQTVYLAQKRHRALPQRYEPVIALIEQAIQ